MTRSNRQRNQFYSSTIAVQDIETLSLMYEKNSDLQVQDDANDNIGRESLNKKIRPLVCDITDLQVDAIVCPTQSGLSLEPYGLSKTVLSRGGLLLQQTCKQIGKIEVGMAAITEGYDLKCKYVIFTAGPSPSTLLDYNQRKACLKRSYRSALKLVRDTPNIRTVAFPLLGSGGAGIELTDAIRISTTTLRSWLNKPKNAKSVDSIVLCFYDPNQYEKYHPQLIYTFPYGKDLAGFDTEALPKSKINIPVKCCKTNILCYKYGIEKIASRQIQQHFNLMVNECHDRLCKQITSDYSDDNFSPKLERYDTSAIIQFGHGHYNLIIYNNADLKSIEIQIVCLSSNSPTIDLKTKCHALREIIKDSLASQFQNRLQFQIAVRCEREVIGQRGHLWDMEYLQHSQRTGEQHTCVHASDADTHALNPVTMLEYWHCDNNFGKALNIDRNGKEHPEESDSLNVSVPSPSVLLPASTPTRDVDEGEWSSSDIQTHTEQSSDAMGCISDLHSPSLNGKVTKQARDSPHHRENGLDRFQKLQKCRKTGESKLECTDSKVSDIAQEGTRAKEIQTINDRHLENNLNISSLTRNGGLCETNMLKEFSNSPICKNHLFLNIDPRVGEENIDPRDSEGSFASLSPSVYSNCSVTSPTSPSVNSNCSVTSPTSEPTLSDRKLLKIARHIGNKQKQLGLELELSDTEIETLRANNVSDVVMYGYEILKKWMLKRRKRWNCEAILADLMNAMNECEIDTVDLEKALGAMQAE